MRRYWRNFALSKGAQEASSLLGEGCGSVARKRLSFISGGCVSVAGGGFEFYK